jgi:ketosteroid isomerase-like protein
MYLQARNILIAMVITIPATASALAQEQNDGELLRVRESVWRAWFAGDAAALEALVPPDTIVISAGEKKWKGQKEVFESSSEFHSAGGSLVGLEFPRTQVQHFGNVAMILSEYVLETVTGGKHSVSSGRASEVFVFRDGHWVNPGWHTDSSQ